MNQLKKNKLIVLLHATLLAITFSMSARAENTLYLGEAETLATSRDALIRASNQQAKALEHKAEAVDSLPDPKLKFGAMNVPTDTYTYDQTPMTQKQLGLSQMFPSWGSLTSKGKKFENLAVAQHARTTIRKEQVMRETRKTWMDLFFWLSANKVVQKNKKLFQQLVRITELQYASGRQNQQDVLRAELELGLLDDRLHQIMTRIEQSRADLAKLVGEDAANRPLPEKLAELPAPLSLTNIQARLGRHPELQQSEAMVAAAQSNVDMAYATYLPTMSLDLTYGQREGQYADGRPYENLASAMLMISIPINPVGRQGERVEASSSQWMAAKDKRLEKHRMLTREVNRTYANWKHLGERLENYKQRLIPQAIGTAESSLRAYQNDRTKFTVLMRARITEIETRLRYQQLRVDRAKTQAQLLYLAGPITKPVIKTAEGVSQ